MALLLFHNLILSNGKITLQEYETAASSEFCQICCELKTLMIQSQERKYVLSSSLLGSSSFQIKVR